MVSPLRATLLVCLFLIVAGTAPAAAADSPEEIANRVAREVMSPFCPGVTLHDCSSGEATELRIQIETWARAGWTEGRIWERLQAEFGDDIRAVPSTEGAGLLAWITPGLALIAGGAAGWLILHRWARRAAPAPLAGPDATPEQRARLERELRRFRGQT